jgi:hypothetical protein
MRMDPTVWKLGSWLAAIRLAALWSIVIGFRYGDWRQVPGFFLQFLILPEALVMRHVRHDRTRWAAGMTLVVLLASYAYAWILVRLRRKTTLASR